MAQPSQTIFNDPNNDWNAVDNTAASTITTLAGPNNPSPIGFDTPANNATQFAGAATQGLNSFGDTGTVLLDSVNDTVYADPSCATFPGNPVSATAPTFAKLTTVLNNNTTGIRILWKNPA